jgi:hypothetical protein
MIMEQWWVEDLPDKFEETDKKPGSTATYFNTNLN